MIYLVKVILQHFSAFTAIIITDLKINVASTRLGYLWWIIDPIVLMLVYYFVIRIVFERGGENYHLFILSGIVLFQFFSRSLTGGMTALISNSALIRQINIPLILFVLVPTVVRGFFALIGIAIVLIAQIENIGWTTILVLPLILVLGIFSFSMSIFLSIANVLIRDTGKLVVYVVRLFFFLSPVLYPSSRVMDNENIPALIKVIYSLNPLAIVIESMRNVALAGEMINTSEIVVLVIVLILLLQFSLFVFRKSTPILLKNI